MVFIKGQVAWNSGKKCPQLSGERNNFWKGGKPRCSDCGVKIGYRAKKCKSCASTGRKFSKPRVTKEEYRRRGILGARSLHEKKETGIETKVYEELKNRELLFEKQYLVNGRFLVDAWIPSLNLIIEADGKYWHDMEKVQKKDKAENAYLTKCGYKLLRLSEEEINSGKFRERLVV